MNDNKKKILISPSILAADFSKLKEEILQMELAGIDMIHFDVMDNHFVPNLTFGPKFVKDFRKYTELPFDVHLMITSPEDSIKQYIDAGADLITIHVEASEKVLDAINIIRNKNVKASLSVKPNTPVNKVFPFLELLDMVLIMSVEPGFAGQSMINYTLDKIHILKEEIKKQNPNCLIQIDGGVNVNNISRLYKLGVDVVVMGSAFFKEKDYKKYINKINALLE